MTVRGLQWKRAYIQVEGTAFIVSNFPPGGIGGPNAESHSFLDFPSMASFLRDATAGASDTPGDKPEANL